VETERLRQALREQRPNELALLAGAAYDPQNADGETLSLDFLGGPVVFGFPELLARRGPGRGAPLPLAAQALLIYYLSTSDGCQPDEEWVSFADLPDGRIYAPAFQGYTGNLLSRAFGEDVPAFGRACQAAGGTPFDLGDAAYAFTALPRVPLLVTYWQGEDDLPSSAKILFDANATHHLPIEVCAILGSMLTHKILAAPRAG
jgi:hypothetical protein